MSEIKEEIHKKIIENLGELTTWYKNKSQDLYFPFYSSYDIRDSCEKITPVDANIYPAGFNNICQIDKESSFQLATSYLESRYKDLKHIGLFTENHTQNPFYWDNVYWIKHLLEEAGFKVYILLPKDSESVQTFESASGHQLTSTALRIVNKKVVIDSCGTELDLIISNNDFTTASTSWIKDIDQEVNPPISLGWAQRKKVHFFDHFNKLIEEFAHIIKVNSFNLQIQTQASKFDVTSEESLFQLKNQAEVFVKNLNKKYTSLGMKNTPYYFLKSNSGTYGLGVIEFERPDDILTMNYKTRKKLKASKGGGGIDEVILQEGIPTSITFEDQSAEPTVYMIGDRLAGGFLRVNKRKSNKQSLNSPGAVFERLCVSDLEIDISGKPLENVYGWISKVSLLAIGKEFESLN